MVMKAFCFLSVVQTCYLWKALFLDNIAFVIAEPAVIAPTRWLTSCLLPIAIAVYGYKKKSLNISGALLGLVVGFVLTLSNYCFLMDLLVFFLSSSKATRYKPHLKRKIEEDFKEGIFS